MRLIFTLMTVLLLAGCQSQYGPMNITGGVNATMITDDTAQIEARGNGNTAPSRIQQFVLLKAAETAVEKGFGGFDLIGTQDTSSSGMNMIGGGYNAFTGMMNPVSMRQTHSPSLVTTVKFIRDASAASFKAEEIIRNLGPTLHGDSVAAQEKTTITNRR